MPEVKAVKFKNYTERDFSWKFNGVEYHFKAGQEMYMEDFKAKHFAKHLVDRELTSLSPKGQDWVGNVVKRAELTALCFPPAEVVSPEKAVDIEAKKKEEAKPAEGGKEEEFPDLKDERQIGKKKVGRPKK